MIVKAVNRKNPGLYEDYDNVSKVETKKDENGNYYHEIQLEDKTTVTYKAYEWAFFKLEWNPLFPTM